MNNLERMNTILSSFDIKRLSTRCNQPDCEKKPEKIVSIFERSIKQRKEIARLYLCEEHINKIKDIKDKLDKSNKKSFIEIEIGTVAQPGRAHD